MYICTPRPPLGGADHQFNRWGQRQSDLACRGAFLYKHEAGFIEKVSHNAVLYTKGIKNRTNSENLSSKWIGVKLEAWKWDADETLGALLF